MGKAVPFTHLHVHSQYSLLDGQASVPGIVDKISADGQLGVALTDHGNMCGIKEFLTYIDKKNSKTQKAINEAREAGDEAEATKLETRLVKPIVGCEMYCARRGRDTRQDKVDYGDHLIVLAKNKTGYKNLIKLVSDGFTKGFYSHPRTDKEQLRQHHEGLIVASACLGGELPKLIMQGRNKEAKEAAEWFHDVFGDDYYIELQRHKTNVPGGCRETYELQQQVNPVLIEIARDLGIKLIATNDSHFVNREDADAHDRLVCIATNHFVSDTDRMTYSKQEWVKTQAEMNEIFSDIPEALSNTREILDKVEVYSIDHAPIMPTFEIPTEFGTEEQYRQKLTEKELFDEFTQDENGQVVLSQEAAEKKITKLGGYEKLYRIKLEADYLASLTYEGAKKRYGDPLSQEMKDRIKFELHIMKTMGFPGYFLIVQDFINAARTQLGVSVGPGRGSAAGSVVAYCLGITQIDPIEYNLLFERFLNPDRISLPDIDVDFDDDGRAEVLRYVTEKYGEEKVAHIITIGTMAAKSAIKDVARVEQLPLTESNRLANLVPNRMPEGKDGKPLKTTLDNCFKYVPEFRPELSSANPLIPEVLDFARRLEGNVRNTGVHACGVIICRDPVTDWVPVSTAVDKASGSKEKLIVTQYEGSTIEDTGLIKMDFLGLKTLSIIKDAVKNIRDTTGQEIDIDAIDINDPKTYKLYGEGRTVGTFQFESAGMQKYLRELQPSTFEDLIAMNALYRPGPMDYIPDFIDRKHGLKPITYDIPVMEQYLKETYGVTVYQEQVMLLSRLLAGFTRGQSDTLRKAMGKKKIDKMMELKELYLKGGQERGHKKEVLEKIWGDWEKFASYAFNKSHATCYSWVAYQTAWLKANYPAEYMAAVLSRNSNNMDKLVPMMDECKRMKIQVLGPDVNESFTAFGVNKKGDIRFGLAAIKGVGENVVNVILESRRSDGPFKTIYDLVERIPSSVMNKKVIEALALAGALDCFKEVRREDIVVPNERGETFGEVLMRYGNAVQQDQNREVASLFGDDEDAAPERPAVTHVAPWPDTVRLDKEKEVVGMYLSAHPLDPYFMELNYCCLTLKNFEELQPVENAPLTIGGMVLDFQSKVSKNGNRFGIMKIEDYSGTTELRMFGQTYINFHNYGIPGTPILIHGSYRRRYQNADLSFEIDSIDLLSSLKGKMLHGITLCLTPSMINDTTLEMLRSHAAKDGEPGGALFIQVYDPAIKRHLRFSADLKMDISRALVDELKAEEIKFAIN